MRFYTVLYKNPRELLWIIGMLIYVSLMAEAFFGYVLPWGNMSFWGAQVIVSLFGAIPGFGPTWWNGSAATTASPTSRLNRFFFALHVAALPLALILLVVVHVDSAARSRV